MKVAIYVRVSTDDQSTAMQLDDLKRYCEFHKLEYDVFQDVQSGKDIKRPAFQDMLGKIKAGHYQKLIIWRLDRVSRSMCDFMQVISILEDAGCQLVSFRENLDMSSATGRLMLNILGSFAQFERDVLSERTKAGLRAARARGVRLGSRPMFLFNMSDVIARRDSGESVESIAKSLGMSRSQLYRRLAG